MITWRQIGPRLVDTLTLHDGDGVVVLIGTLSSDGKNAEIICTSGKSIVLHGRRSVEETTVDIEAADHLLLSAEVSRYTFVIVLAKPDYGARLRPELLEAIDPPRGATNPP